MASTGKVIAVALLLVVGGALVYSTAKNPEKNTLTDSDRAGVPGKFVTLPHGVTHYEIAGPDTGRVVVMVHGFSVPAYIWDSTFIALSNAGFRTVRYDVYGRGWSDRPDEAYDGALFDAQIDGLLDSLHITGPIDLMGLSFGGYVTGHYAAGHKSRVRTLTLVDPVASRTPIPAMLKLPVVGPLIWQTTAVPGMADNQASDFLHPERFPRWDAPYRPQMRYKGFGRALLRSSITGSNTDFDSLYAGVAKTGVPVLLIWGKQDPTVNFRLSEGVLKSIPNAEFFPVDSSGHLPHMEQTAKVNARLLEFFAAHR
ncbi:MAG: alpha/beta hydrolase [Gemmatimonadaceae bacterium]